MLKPKALHYWFILLNMVAFKKDNILREILGLFPIPRFYQSCKNDYVNRCSQKNENIARLQKADHLISCQVIELFLKGFLKTLKLLTFGG